MKVYVLRDTDLVIVGVYMSAESAMSYHQSSDWTRDGGGAWHSAALGYAITVWEAKG